MIKINSVKLRNWRNFGSAELRLEERLFVVGANASGKSNLLDVFRFLRDITVIGLQKSVDKRGGTKKLRFLNARNPSHIGLYVSLSDIHADGAVDEWCYNLEFNTTGQFGSTTQVNIRSEYVEMNGTILLERKFSDQSEDYTSRQFTHLEHPTTNAKFRLLFDYFKEISYVNIIPQLIRESDSFIPSYANEDYYGRNLLETISSTAKKTRESRLRKISQILKLAVPQFSSLRFVVNEKDNRPHLEVKYEHFRPSGAYQQEDQFSDGTLRLIGIIWAIMDGDGLLLLEEPELYLHSEIVRQLPLFIDKAQKRAPGVKRQIIISSHSVDLLNDNSIGANEIALLIPEREGSKIVIADTLKEVNDLLNAGFTPADAVLPQVTPQSLKDGQLSFFNVWD